MIHFQIRSGAVWLIALATILIPAQATFATDDAKADSPAQYGAWETVEGNEGSPDRAVLRLKVHPQAAPVPALKHRLILTSAERVEGNSALFYLKAMGFLENTHARTQLSKMEEKWRKEATAKKQSDYAPHIWSNMPPELLPLDEVEKYLDLISFQEPMLFTAARRKNYSQDRAMEREDNPIGYLLPEVQLMRQLARNQVVRLRYAVAQDRIDDAVEILRQMMTMANHLGNDQFLVSGLVAIAVQGISVHEGFMFTQHPEAPNLYWAIASCPQPFVDLTPAFEWEQTLLLDQIPMLAEVNETPQSKEYWIDFIRRLVPKWNEYIAQANEWGSGKLPENIDETQLVYLISTHHKPARRYLSEVVGIADETLDKFHPAQTCFLALVRYWQISVGENLRHFYLPHPSRKKLTASDIEENWQSELGWIAKFPETLVAASEQISRAQTRGQQRMAMWQTIEAIRMTAAADGGKAPQSLDDLVMPAPLDPATLKVFEYSADGQTVTITGGQLNRVWQVVVEVVEPVSKEQE